MRIQFRLIANQLLQVCDRSLRRHALHDVLLRLADNLGPINAPLRLSNIGAGFLTEFLDGENAGFLEGLAEFTSCRCRYAPVLIARLGRLVDWRVMVVAEPLVMYANGS